MRKKLSATLILAFVLFVGWGTLKTSTYQTATAQQISDQERVAQNKQSILSRMKRNKVEFRGDGADARVKSEWVDEMVRDYSHQKLLVVGELSVMEKYELRSRWVFKDMKVTFQELFNLGPEDDEKLFPLSYGDELLDMVPSYSFEGLTFLGKGGEVKGPFKRCVAITGPSLALVGNLGTGLRGPAVIFPLYVNREGREKMALGIARDAYTVKWKDIKDRVVDDMSQAVYLDKLKLLRDYVSEEEFRRLQ